MLSINSNPNNIAKLESYLNGLSCDFKFDKEQYADILISLTEAVNNAMIHGNQRDENKQVNIFAKRIKGGISFFVTDEGKGFNPNQVEDPTLAKNLEECGGRGVFIMKMLCDDINYTDNGRCVEMHFHLNKD